MLLLLLQALAERGRTQENRADPPAGRGNEATAKKGPRPGNTTKSQPTLGVLLLISLPAPLFIYTILCIGYCILYSSPFQSSIQPKKYIQFFLYFFLSQHLFPFFSLSYFLCVCSWTLYFLSSIKKIYIVLLFFLLFCLSARVLLLLYSCYLYTFYLSIFNTIKESAFYLSSSFLSCTIGLSFSILCHSVFFFEHVQSQLLPPSHLLFRLCVSVLTYICFHFMFNPLIIC